MIYRGLNRVPLKRPIRIGALIIGIGFLGGHSTIIMLRNPQNNVGTYLGPYSRFFIMRPSEDEDSR